MGLDEIINLSGGRDSLYNCKVQLNQHAGGVHLISKVHALTLRPSSHPPLYDNIVKPQPSPLDTPNPTSRDSTAALCNIGRIHRLDSVAHYNARYEVVAVAAG